METKKLGFGLMRLPTLNNGEIDIEQVKQMADAFLENGFTYFDTSYVYHNGKSEDALKQAVVMRHPRESFTIATKFPTFAVQTEDQVEPIFAQQLKNLGTSYVDYYLLHILNTKLYNGVDGKGGVVKTCHLFDHVRQWKRQGKVRHMGFSFHDSAELLDQILTENPDVEFVQIVINYFDWESSFIQSRACYEIIRRHGKKVVVMEPVKGGCLAALPEASEQKLKAIDPDASPASWALRFAATQEGVLTVLSGMSNLAQMEDNLSFMRDFRPLNGEEREIIRKAQRLRGRSSAVPCTACHYCTEGCPKGIAIPEIFSAMNLQLANGQLEEARKAYGKAAPEGRRASDCIGCGQCERACPQHLKVTEHLRAGAEMLEDGAPGR